MHNAAEVGLTWHLVGPTASLKTGEPLVRKIANVHIAIYRLGADEFSALSDICTHEYASLSKGFIEDCTIECPLHQARFDLRTGKCYGPFADKDLQTFPVKVEEGNLFVGIAA